MGRLLITIVLLFWLAVPPKVWATDWYVDNAASGSNNGTSWTDAWQTLAAITYGAGGVLAGDTVYISGGSTSKTYPYTDRINMVPGQSEGSDAITFKVGQDSGHNGWVVFDNAEQNQSIIQSHTHSTTFDGFVNGEKRMLFANGFQSRHVGLITKDGASDFLFRGIIFSNAAIALVETGGKRGVVELCEFIDIRGDAAIRLNSRNSAQTNGWYEDTFIRSNTITVNVDTAGSAYGPDGIQGCRALTVENNVFNNTPGTLTWSPPSVGQHVDYIQTGNYNIQIRGNEFKQIADSAIDQDGSVITGTGLGWLKIYNNLFWMTNSAEIPTGIRIYDNTAAVTGVTNVLIANNTFVDLAEGTTYGAGIGVGGARATNTVFEGIIYQNNLHVNVGSSVKPVFNNVANSSHDIANWSFDYNAVWVGQSGTNNYIINGTGYTQSNGQEGEPSFVSYSPLSASNDFHLSSDDTIAKDNGVDLSAYFTTDFDGNTRSGSWDIGAFEFQPVLPPAASGSSRRVPSRSQGGGASGVGL